MGLLYPSKYLLGTVFNNKICSLYAGPIFFSSILFYRRFRNEDSSHELSNRKSPCYILHCGGVLIEILQNKQHEETKKEGKR